MSLANATDEWDPTATDPVGPEFPHLVAWVEQWLAPTLRHQLRGTEKWCRRWWAHPEAAARLGALWAAWEVASAEGGSAMSQWWLYHFDGHWPRMTDSRGPFAGCTDTECLHHPPLPTEPYPYDL